MSKLENCLGSPELALFFPYSGCLHVDKKPDPHSGHELGKQECRNLKNINFCHLHPTHSLL